MHLYQFLFILFCGLVASMLTYLYSKAEKYRLKMLEAQGRQEIYNQKYQTAKANHINLKRENLELREKLHSYRMERNSSPLLSTMVEQPVTPTPAPPVQISSKRGRREVLNPAYDQNTPEASNHNGNLSNINTLFGDDNPSPTDRHSDHSSYNSHSHSDNSSSYSGSGGDFGGGGSGSDF